MLRRRLTIALGLLVVIAFGSIQGFDISLAQGAKENTTEYGILEGWDLFKDTIRDFSLAYPNDWEAAHSAIGTASDPLYVIRDEYRFEGSDGEGFHIMTFLLPKDQPLRVWFEEHKFPEPEVEAPEKENAIIGGIPAFVLVVPETKNSQPAFWALWVYKDYVFWLEGSLETETFTKVLESLRFEGVENAFSLPKQVQGYWGVATNCYDVSDRCCDVDDVGNPYPCCYCCCKNPCSLPSDTLWARCDSTGRGEGSNACCSSSIYRGCQCGNCVWWASYMRQDTGGTRSYSWGSPDSWVSRARYYGFSVGLSPKVGSIAVNAGHVAYVRKAFADGSFEVSEMNACTETSSATCKRIETYSRSSGAWFFNGAQFIYPPLELTSSLTVPSYIDSSSGSVTIEARVRNRSGVAVGKGGSSLLWQLRVTDPYGVVHHWSAPACYKGFDPGSPNDGGKTFRLTFLKSDYSDILCQANGPYQIEGLEYYESISGKWPEPDEYIPVMNPNNYQNRVCLNACCASGSSSILGVSSQGCPDYCGGALPPTPTTHPIATPTPTKTPPPPAPPSGSIAVTVFENNKCGDGPYDGPHVGMYQCYNLAYGAISRSFRLQTNRPVYIRFYTRSNCSTADRQWGGTFSSSGCYQLGSEVTDNTKVLSFIIEDPPATATFTPTSKPLGTAPPTRTPTSKATATIGPNQKGFEGFVYRKDKATGIAGVSLSLHYYLPAQNRWVGAGGTQTDASGHFLLRTQHTATLFLVTVLEIPSWARYGGVIIHHQYASRADERAILWTLPSESTVGYFGSDFFLVGHPKVSTPTPTRTSTVTPTATKTVTPTATSLVCESSVVHFLDWPPDQSQLSSPVTFSGWAIDTSASAGTGITAVRIVLNLSFPQVANYGQERPDIAQGWGEHYRYSGYQYTVDLNPGTYSVLVQAVDHCGRIYTTKPRTFSVVANNEATSTPTSTVGVLHYVDNPQEGGTYGSPVYFSGWSVMRDGASVEKIEFYLDLPRGQVGKYGEVTPNQYRADLPEPYKNSGWTFRFDPAWVNAGTHSVYVYVVDQGEVLAMTKRTFVTY